MKKVLVIVVTYNGMPWLERCLGSVDADLFVWDNASKDGSADYVARHFPQAHLVRSAENAFFAHPNDEGLRWAVDHGYDYAYLLNQDAWLEEGALETLLAAASEHPEYAVLCPLQLAPDVTLDANFSKVYGPEGDTRSRISGHPRPDKGEGPRASACKARRNGRGRSEAEVIRDGVSSAGPVPVKRVMAAHWLVNLEAVRKVGLFNEELFPLYGQDDDWCNRARYHGYKIGIVPEARGIHDRAQRAESKDKLIDRNYRSASLLRLADVNRPLWASALYVCLFTLVKAVKYVSFKPIGLFPGICRQLPAIRRCRANACKSVHY